MAHAHPKRNTILKEDKKRPGRGIIPLTPRPLYACYIPVTRLLLRITVVWAVALSATHPRVPGADTAPDDDDYAHKIGQPNEFKPVENHAEHLSFTAHQMPVDRVLAIRLCPVAG